MKYLFFIGLFLLILNFYSCSGKKGQSVKKIILTNTSSFNLTDKAIAINREQLLPIRSDAAYPLLIDQRGDTIPTQLDDLDGDGHWDELFFVINLPGDEQDTFDLSWINTAIKFKKRTTVRFGMRPTFDSKISPATIDTFYADQLPGVIGYQHFQTDGPTWENDKVGFRLYLDGRNSIDVFGKTVSYMTPDNVGIGKDGVTENNYSVMKDWGTDILDVGNSVGIGGISLLINDKLARLGVTEKDSLDNVDTTIFKIISKGPVRSLMKVTYKDWKPNDRNYFAEETISMWPGMYGFRNSVRLTNLTSNDTLVVGLVNSNTNQKLTEITINDKWVALITDDKQSVNKQWWLGLALVLPRKNYAGYFEAPKSGAVSKTYLGKLKVQNNEPVNYFAFAGWELSDKRFSDPDYFKKYIVGFFNQLSVEVKVKVN